MGGYVKSQNLADDPPRWRMGIEIVFPRIVWWMSADTDRDLTWEQVTAGEIQKDTFLLLPGMGSTKKRAGFLMGKTRKRASADILADEATLLREREASGEMTEPKPKRKGDRRKPGGKKHDLDGHDKWAVECLIKEIALGKRPRGTPRIEDTEVMRILLDRIKTHSTLKHATMPFKRTLQGWISKVRRGGTIPGSIAGRVL